jgi:hypothetical protein
MNYDNINTAEEILTAFHRCGNVLGRKLTCLRLWLGEMSRLLRLSIFGRLLGGGTGVDFATG